MIDMNIFKTALAIDIIVKEQIGIPIYKLKTI